jgi:hypothetical protein
VTEDFAGWDFKSQPTDKDKPEDLPKHPGSYRELNSIQQHSRFREENKDESRKHIFVSYFSSFRFPFPE